ncbi:MAG: TonB family protein [Acidobacteriota bacterium]
MGKIVKFCSSCDEGFAEKFAFCPNCGQTLQSFEMNPVVAEAPPVEEIPIIQPVAAAPVAEEVTDKFQTYIEPAKEAAPSYETVITEPEPVAEEPVAEEPVIAQPAEEEAVIEEPIAEAVVAAPATKVAAVAQTHVFQTSKALDADSRPKSFEAEHAKFNDAGGFYVTVIEEKNGKQRNALIVGAFGFMIFALMSALVYNIFSKDLEVGSINDDVFNAVIVDDVPAEVEEVQKKAKDDGGGGGGGGRQQDETTLGDRANQTKNPERPPEAIPRLDHPLELPPASTQGNQTYPPKYDRYGDPNGRFSSWNNGSGTGGGQGTGTGTGQGSGRGTGNGSGNGSGSGNGIGNGNGNGSGDGDGPPPPPSVPKVTVGIKIISKPRPGYTDAARTANIQGTVILRVTFLASGQIGSISPVKGLPNGLTEQAIAAAHRISFEPAKSNGIPIPVTKQIEYSFSIY